MSIYNYAAGLDEGLKGGRNHGSTLMTHEESTGIVGKTRKVHQKTNRMLSNTSTDKVSQFLEVEDDNHSNRILRELHEYQRTGKLCDVVLNTRDGKVLAHKLVLMLASAELYEMLNKPDTNSAGIVTYVDLLHIPFWALENIITFIYSGKLQLPKSKVKQFSKYCRTLGLPILEENILSKQTPSCKSARATKDYSDHSSAGTREVLSTSRKRKHITKGRPLAKCNSQDDRGVYDSICDKNKNEIKIISKREENQVKNICMLEIETSVKATDVTKDEIIKRQSPRKLINKIEKAESTIRIESLSSQDMSTAPPCDNVYASQYEYNSRENKTDDPINVYNENNDEFSSEIADYDNVKDDNDADSDYKPPDKKTRIAKKSDKNMFKENSNDFKEKCNTETKINIDNQNDVLLCSKCKESFDDQQSLINHSKKCKTVKPRKRCVLCKISFESAVEYKIHRKTDEKCLEYRKEKHKKDLVRRAKSKNKYPCKVCPRRFRRVADAVEHEFLAHELPYDKEQWPDQICEYCSYWTISQFRLRHHQMYDCSKGQDFICDVCGNKYKNEKTLKLHKNVQHEAGIPMLPCDQCGKLLKGPKTLKSHKQIVHEGENPLKRLMCHICSMKYKTSSDLTFHLYRSHNQPLPDNYKIYKCAECDYIINSKRTYEKHTFLHSDKRDFHCEHCSKSFKTQNTLRNHIAYHKGEKIPCPYEGCSYSALKNTRLKSHIANQHTQKGAKNEECHLCAYSTFFRGNLIKHLRKVHQLEVVTRHNVHMKAKYKNFKSGDIVGPINHHDNSKEMNKVGLKSMNSEKISDANKQKEPDKNADNTTFNDNISEIAKNSNDPIPRNTENRIEHFKTSETGQVATPSFHNVEAGIAMPYVFGATGMAISSNTSNVIFGTPSGLLGSHEVSMQVGGRSLREINLAMAHEFSSKLAAGVTPPKIFQPQIATDNDVKNGDKMRTYFQM